MQARAWRYSRQDGMSAPYRSSAAGVVTNGFLGDGRKKLQDAGSSKATSCGLRMGGFMVVEEGTGRPESTAPKGSDADERQCRVRDGLDGVERLPGLVDRLRFVGGEAADGAEGPVERGQPVGLCRAGGGCRVWHRTEE